MRFQFGYPTFKSGQVNSLGQIEVKCQHHCIIVSPLYHLWVVNSTQIFSGRVKRHFNEREERTGQRASHVQKGNHRERDVQKGDNRPCLVQHCKRDCLEYKENKDTMNQAMSRNESINRPCQHRNVGKEEKKKQGTSHAWENILLTGQV